MVSLMALCSTTPRRENRCARCDVPVPRPASPPAPPSSKGRVKSAPAKTTLLTLLTPGLLVELKALYRWMLNPVQPLDVLLYWGLGWRPTATWTRVPCDGRNYINTMCCCRMGQGTPQYSADRTQIAAFLASRLASPAGPRVARGAVWPGPGRARECGQVRARA
jgi:hypothetical protein